MLYTRTRSGLILARPGAQEIRRIEAINARLWPGHERLSYRRANPDEEQPTFRAESPLLVPHFWTGQLVPNRVVAAARRTHTANTYVLWEGPSEIDGEPIMLIGSGFQKPSENIKTGPMVQTHILRRDMSPAEASARGYDKSICGACLFAGGDPEVSSKHKYGTYRPGRLCYVVIGQDPTTHYKSYAAGKLTKVPEELLSDLFLMTDPLRVGSYGDPAAVPERIWRLILRNVNQWTGYTHQWLDPRFQGFKDFCMASVNNADEAVYAQKIMGWSTYRMGGPEDPPMEGMEIACLYENEGGGMIRMQCDSCGMCTGRTRIIRRERMGKEETLFQPSQPWGIVDPVHGRASKEQSARAYRRLMTSDEALKGFTTAEGTVYPPGYFNEVVVPLQRLYMERENRRNLARLAHEERRQNPCSGHPAARRPRSREEVRDRLDDLRRRAGLTGRAELAWPHDLTALHERNHRRYAQVYFPAGQRLASAPRYELAEQARWLPERQLRGVLAHEVGHELTGPSGTERGADRAAEEALGFGICYDNRWPGKGLQSKCNPGGLDSEYCVTYTGIDEEGRDLPEELLFCGSADECWLWLHKNQSQSVSWALEHGGYKISKAPW